jgi:DNA-binding MarR family transcriptional regulator
MNRTPPHLAALEAMLAQDKDIGRLHTRHVQIVCLLCQHRTPLPVHMVAALAGVDSPRVSRLADKLVERGLVTRSDDPADRRIALLEPTPEGRALDQRVRRMTTEANKAVSA